MPFFGSRWLGCLPCLCETVSYWSIPKSSTLDPAFRCLLDIHADNNWFMHEAFTKILTPWSRAKTKQGNLTFASPNQNLGCPVPFEPHTPKRRGPFNVWGPCAAAGEDSSSLESSKKGASSSSLKLKDVGETVRNSWHSWKTSTFRIPKSKVPTLLRCTWSVCWRIVPKDMAFRHTLPLISGAETGYWWVHALKNPAPLLSFSAPAASASVTPHLGLPDPVLLQ